MKKQIILFCILGVILALIAGSVVFLLNSSEPGQEECMRSFVKDIAEGNLTNARSLFISEKQADLRSPYNALSESVYRNLKLTGFANVLNAGQGCWTADVRLETIDTMQVMSKANFLFYERLAERETLTDEESAALLEDIYEEILSRDDLPKTEFFCIVTFTKENGGMRIVPDDKLMSTLEGNVDVNAGALDTLMDIALGADPVEE